MMRTRMVARVSMPVLVVALLILTSCSKDNPADPEAVSDNTPPAAIANLAATSSTTNSVTLTWTAPGDDGSTGSATQYDIRYALSSITEVTWDSALQASSEPTPKAAGGSEIFVVSGLSEYTKYYFAVKAADEKSNWSPVSNVVNRTTLEPADVTPPSAINDLVASDPAIHSVTLTWTAPGDDETTGTAYRYDIRYSESFIDESNWVLAIPASGEPFPSPAGSAEQFVVTNLSASTGYYFAIKSTDESYNKSGLSNVASASTPSCTDCWLPLGKGVALNELGPPVNALAVYDGKLVAGGWLDLAGEVAAYRVAAWDGASWGPLGSGPSNDNGVYAMAVYDGRLATGSNVDSPSPIPIFLWSGVSWSPVTGMNYKNIFALTVYGTRLIAGGMIYGAVACEGVAAWNGSSWSALGTGLTGGQYSFAQVYALAEYDGKLIAAGNFATAGGVSAGNIAAWDGSSWSPLGSGVSDGSNTGTVLALAVYDGKLIAGGGFTTAGGSPANSIAAWDGSTWSPLGQGVGAGTVFALAVHNGQLVAGGIFASAGDIPASNIAIWNGSSWSALGAGINGMVRALTVFNTQLIAGGSFTAADGYPASCVAVWKD
jgi:hypothetical protein